METRGVSWSRWTLAAVLLATAVAYLPALSGGLLFDDIPLLANSECWRGVARIPAMLGLDGHSACTYRPIRYLTFAVDYSLAGMSPSFLHLSNLAYHLVTTLLVYLLLRRFCRPLGAALLAGLWCLHPVQTDSVAYISGRRDIVSTLLFLVAALQLIRRGGERPRPAHWAVAAGAFVLAVFTKEMAVTLPAVVGGYFLLVQMARGSAPAGTRAHTPASGGEVGERRSRPAGRLGWGIWAALAALVLGAAAFVVYRGVIASHSGMQGRWWGGSITTNFATVLVLYANYARLLLWPDALIGDYFHPVTIPLAESFADPRSLIGLAVVLIILVGVVMAVRRRSVAVAFGLGWFLVTLLPVSHILPHHELFAEHYLYLPSIGLAIAVAPLADRWVGGAAGRRAVAVSTAAALLLAYGWRVWDRAHDWQSERAFYEAAVEHAPRNARVLYHLGVIDAEAGRCESALEWLESAMPGLSAASPMGRDARVAFILCSQRLGREAGIGEAAEALIRERPDDPFGWAVRGRQRFERGDSAGAVSDFERSVSLFEGRDADAVLYLLMALNQTAQHERVLAVLDQYPLAGGAPGICEQEVMAHLALGVSHYARALERADACLAQWPDSIVLLELRASLFYSAGRFDLAERDVARLRELGAPEEALERLRALRARVTAP